MTNLLSKKWLLGAVVAVLGWANAAADVNAGWWHRHGSSGGSSGSWGSSGSSGSYGSSGSWGSSGSSGSWGSSGSSGGSHGGGWAARRAARRAAHASSGSWGSSGSSGSSGGSYGSSGSWGSSGSSGGSSGSSGSWGSSGSSGGYTTTNDVIIEDGAVIEEGAAPATEGAAPAAEGATTEPQAMHSADSAVLTVQVPTDAKIFVNGVATTSEGAERNYVSRDLRPGFNYTYELRAEFVREGKPVTETKSVTLTAGQTARVDFEAVKTAAAGEPLTTVLKVNVPANAKVFLAGHETDSFGSVRELSTSRLNSGEQWENYTIRVEAEVDGRTETQEETITLAAGDNREVNFDFAAAKVASK
jgi:uncharacterized protein (TIGR03000 family)